RRLAGLHHINVFKVDPQRLPFKVRALRYALTRCRRHELYALHRDVVDVLAFRDALWRWRLAMKHEETQRAQAHLRTHTPFESHPTHRSTDKETRVHRLPRGWSKPKRCV